MGVHRKVRGDAQDAGSRMRGVLGRPSLLAIQFPQLTPLTLRTPFPAATSLLSLLATSPLLTLHLSLFDDEEIHDAPITPSLHAIPSHSPSPMLHQRGLGHNSHRRDEMAASFLRPQRNPSRTRWGSGAHTPIPSSRKAPSSPTRAHRWTTSSHLARNERRRSGETGISRERERCWSIRRGFSRCR